MKRYRMQGFTLVELLVVMTVIGILAGLTLVALGPVKEVFRKMNCASNLHNLALAAATYEANYQTFPPYKFTDPGNWNWTVPLLPYLDRPDLWNKFSRGNGNDGKAVLTVVTCPSDPPEATNPSESPCGYSLNFRVGGGNLENPQAAATPYSSSYIASKDGAGTTLLFGEKRLIHKLQMINGQLPNPSESSTGLGNRAINWWDVTETRVSGTPNISVHCFADGVAPNKEQLKFVPIIRATNLPISSSHNGGANVAFCDGHTAFLKDTINLELFNAITSPDNSENEATVKVDW